MWFNCDPCGIAAVIFGWTTVLVSNVSIQILLSRWYGALTLPWVAIAPVYQLVIVMVFWSHLKTIFTDPGALPLGKPPPSEVDGAEQHRRGGLRWIGPTSVWRCITCVACCYCRCLQQCCDDTESDEESDFEDHGLYQKQQTLTPIFGKDGAIVDYSAESQDQPDLLPDDTIHQYRRPRKPRVCTRCYCRKPPHTHHCGTCGRCVAHMDHHCPWVNNCVGVRNHKFFLLFLLYVELGTLFSLGLFFLTGLQCVGGFIPNCVLFPDLGYVPLLYGVAVALDVCFACFVGCMIYDQWEVIETGIGVIDRLQGAQGEVGDEDDFFWDQLTVIFGEPFSFRWFLPVLPLTVQGSSADSFKSQKNSHTTSCKKTE